jgi:hypothetical protein
MTTRQFVSSKGETWEWEETPDVLKAIKQLHNKKRAAEIKRLDDELGYSTGSK